MLHRLHEAKQRHLEEVKSWEKQEMADILRWRQYRARVLAAEGRKQHNLEMKRKFLARKHALSVAAAKHTLNGHQKELLRLEAQTVQEKAQQKFRIQELLKKISHKQ